MIRSACIRTARIALGYTNRRLPGLLKTNSVAFVKNSLSQVEFVIGYRLKRRVQLLILYSKLGDESAISKCIQLIKRILSRRADFLLAAGVYKFIWDEQKIPDADLQSRMSDIAMCEKLRDKIGFERSDWSEELESGESWNPFINEEDLTVWKSNMFEETNACSYKVFGKFDDVTVSDFLEVYLDVETRLRWDKHAVHLSVIDADSESNSMVIYWESKWPKMFQNRDYVFNRRYTVDKMKKIVVVASRGTDHPNVPEYRNKTRVRDYWSYIVLRATNEFDKPGMEFCLTYHDNPGTNLPSSIYLWATLSSMPNYLKTVRREALAIAEERARSINRKPFLSSQPIPESAVEVDHEQQLPDNNSIWDKIKKPYESLKEDFLSSMKGATESEHKEGAGKIDPFLFWTSFMARYEQQSKSVTSIEGQSMDLVPLQKPSTLLLILFNKLINSIFESHYYRGRQKNFSRE